MRKAAVVTTISVAIALVHMFRLGSHLNDPWFTLYYSYFSDILVPFGFYFLLALSEFSIRPLRSWWAKAIIVFLAATTTEILQAFGVPLLGLTFDPLDIVMFGAGVLLAVIVDTLIFRRIFSFWQID